MCSPCAATASHCRVVSTRSDGDDVEIPRHSEKAAFTICHTSAAAKAPHGADPLRPQSMREASSHRGHFDSCLSDYTAGRLESALEREIEAHLLVCDRCFAALVAEVVIGPRIELNASSA